MYGWLDRRILGPALLWLALWASINSGPWVLETLPETPSGCIHFARALTPLVVLAIALFAVAKGRRPVGLPGPLKYWAAYAVIGLAGCTRAIDPLTSAYWIAAYLATLGALVLFLRSGDPLVRAIQLNQLSWLATALTLLVLLVAARNALFAETSTGVTAYGISNRLPEVAGMAMSIASGMGRFAGVTGIVAFAAAWYTAGPKRLLALAICLGSGLMVYWMQSRGAIFAFFFACMALLWLFEVRSRLLAFALAALAVLTVALDMLPQSLLAHIARGQSHAQLVSLTGRTRAWENGWEAAMESPLIGWGGQADRWLIGEHVHNAYFYALLQSGIPGAVLFIAGWLVSLWLLLCIFRLSPFRVRDDILVLMQVTGVLIFFAIRSIPEVSGAMFSIDLLILTPAMAYVALACEKNRPSKPITPTVPRI